MHARREREFVSRALSSFLCEYGAVAEDTPEDWTAQREEESEKRLNESRAQRNTGKGDHKDTNEKRESDERSSAPINIQRS